VRQGRMVIIEDGPLKGAEGVFLRIGSEHRLIVGVSLLQRWVTVKVDPQWIKLSKPQEDLYCHR